LIALPEPPIGGVFGYSKDPLVIARAETLKKLEALCCSCIKDTPTQDKLVECVKEAEKIADAYVKMWQKWANHRNSYGVWEYNRHVRASRARGVAPRARPADIQNYGHIRSGWMCYHWRTLTFSAVKKLGTTVFKVGYSGHATRQAGARNINLEHNWVVLSIGKSPQMLGPCTLRLDPWLGRGPRAYAQAEHGHVANVFGTEARGIRGVMIQYMPGGRPRGRQVSTGPIERWPDWVKEGDL
jgi:hypothetical protein